MNTKPPTAPTRDAAMSVNSAPGRPRNAPIMKIILTSPKPSPSRWRTFSYSHPANQMEPLDTAAPINASPTDTHRGPHAYGTTNSANSPRRGTNHATIKPSTPPPTVNSSGKMRSSKSEAISAIMIAENSAYFKAGGVTPNAFTQIAKAMPVESSTSG